MVGDSPLGPFKATSIAAPPTHFNPHAYHFDDGSETGIYVLYTNGGTFSEGLHARSTGAAAAASPPGKTRCNGAEARPSVDQPFAHTNLPFVHPAGNCTSTLCAVYATSLDGPWSMRNVDSHCTNNAVPFQLKNGSLLMAGTCGSNTATTLKGNDGEQITMAIAEPKAFFGPFVAIKGKGFGGNLWDENEPGEDPTIFQDVEENVPTPGNGICPMGMAYINAKQQGQRIWMK